MNTTTICTTHEVAREARMLRQFIIRNQPLIQQECDYDLSTATDALTKALNTYIETLDYLMEQN